MDDEKYSDPLDVASRNEMYATNEAIREQRLKCKPQQEPDADGNYLVHECLECGDHIGEQRLRVAIKNLYCVECVSAQERKAKK
jgi:RNA polymerase-binding transcription factor DksA